MNVREGFIHAPSHVSEPELLQQIVHDDFARYLGGEGHTRPMILSVLIEL